MVVITPEQAVDAINERFGAHAGYRALHAKGKLYRGTFTATAEAARLSRAVLLGAVPPLMLKTGANPGGLPIETFDTIRAGVAADRSQFYRDLSAPFYGANRPGSTVSAGLREWFWLMSMQVGVKGAYDCVKAFSETDFTEDLKRFDTPTLIIHGDDDQIVPIADSALLSAKLVKDSTLKVYPGAPHGLANTVAYKETFNADLLAFIKT